ncbi:Fc.00g052840.m01.CDS01 [Cosmosporella sp. VM-42]
MHHEHSELDEPYASDIVEVFFDDEGPLRIHRQILCKSPVFSRLIESDAYSKKSGLRVHDISLDAGHVVIHYLLTKKYKCLQPQDQACTEKDSSAFVTALRVQAAAQSLELPALGSLAEARMRRQGEKLSLPCIIEMIEGEALNPLKVPCVAAYLESHVQEFYRNLTPAAAEAVLLELGTPVTASRLMLKSMVSLRLRELGHGILPSEDMDQVAEPLEEIQDGIEAEVEVEMEEQPVEAEIDEQPVEAETDEQPVEMDEQPVEAEMDEQPVEAEMDEQLAEAEVDEQPVEAEMNEQPADQTVASPAVCEGVQEREPSLELATSQLGEEDPSTPTQVLDVRPAPVSTVEHQDEVPKPKKKSKKYLKEEKKKKKKGKKPAETSPAPPKHDQMVPGSSDLMNGQPADDTPTEIVGLTPPGGEVEGQESGVSLILAPDNEELAVCDHQEEHLSGGVSPNCDICNSYLEKRTAEAAQREMQAEVMA